MADGGSRFEAAEVDDLFDDAAAAAAATATTNSRDEDDGSAAGVHHQQRLSSDDADLGSYLERYMGRRAEEEAAGAASGSVFEALRQKERDLLLAAELGRALLCSNAQLKADAELARGELEGRLAQLEREKAGLLGKLDSAELDWDAQMRDLQAETRALREELRRQQLARLELVSANERLAEECRQSVARVAELQSELRARRVEAQDRLARAADEAADLRAERLDLERRLCRAAAERDAVAAAGEEARARLEARAAELTDAVAQMRDRLAATVAVQRRQQMELAEEQLFQQQHQHHQQFFGIPVSPVSPAAAAASAASIDGEAAASGESLFSELGGFCGDSGQLLTGGVLCCHDNDEDDIEVDEVACDDVDGECDDAGCRCRATAEAGLEASWGRQTADSMAQLVQGLQEELHSKNQQLEEKCCEIQQLKSELSCQRQQADALVASESASRREQRVAVEKRICLESQLSRMKAEVDRLNSELSTGGGSADE